MEKTCNICGEPYVPKAKHQKYCSRPCALKAVHDRNVDHTIEPRPCEHCGEEFRPKQKSSAGRFCSRACMYAGSTGEGAAHWRGGRYIDDNGYVKIYAPNHPARQGKGGYVAEHRLVMETAIGRHLESHETVHHIDGNPQNNVLGNLQLRFGKHGKGIALKCRVCGSQDIVPVPLADQRR